MSELPEFDVHQSYLQIRNGECCIVGRNSIAKVPVNKTVSLKHGMELLITREGESEYFIKLHTPSHLYEWNVCDRLNFNAICRQMTGYVEKPCVVARKRIKINAQWPDSVTHLEYSSSEKRIWMFDARTGQSWGFIRLELDMTNQQFEFRTKRDTVVTLQLTGIEGNTIKHVQLSLDGKQLIWKNVEPGYQMSIETNTPAPNGADAPNRDLTPVFESLINRLQTCVIDDDVDAFKQWSEALETFFALEKKQ